MFATLQGMSSILAAVQAQVAKEAVVWRSGPLVMAPLVKSTLAATEVMGSVIWQNIITNLSVEKLWREVIDHIDVPRWTDCVSQLLLLSIITMVPKPRSKLLSSCRGCFSQAGCLQLASDCYRQELRVETNSCLEDAAPSLVCHTAHHQECQFTAALNA